MVSFLCMGDRQIELDEDLCLLHLQDWAEDVATGLAKEEGIG